MIYAQVTINRDGTVTAHQLTKASSHKALNREVMALINRAQPLPPPPKEVGGETIAFTLPVSFSLKR